MQLNYLAPLVSFQDGSATVLESKLTLFLKICYKTNFSGVCSSQPQVCEVHVKVKLEKMHTSGKSLQFGDNVVLQRKVSFFAIFTHNTIIQ
jgi:hypothetical protein